MAADGAEEDSSFLQGCKKWRLPIGAIAKKGCSFERKETGKEAGKEKAREAGNESHKKLR